MSNARDRMHQHRCGARKCRLDTDDKQQVAQTCRLLDHLLDQVEEDRLHQEAEKLRASTVELGDGPFSEGIRSHILAVAHRIDPYIKMDRQLYRKADGRVIGPS